MIAIADKRLFSKMLDGRNFENVTESARIGYSCGGILAFCRSRGKNTILVLNLLIATDDQSCFQCFFSLPSVILSIFIDVPLPLAVARFCASFGEISISH